MAPQPTTAPFPARQRQHQLLREALRHTYPVIAWGGPSTGKRSTVLSAIPPAVDCRVIDCVRAHGDAALFQAIAGAAWPGPERGGRAADATQVLIDALNARAASDGAGVLVLVLVRAERLREAQFRPDALETLLSLCQLVKRPNMLRVVLVSRVPWAALRDTFDLNVREPRCVWFPNYTGEEIVPVVLAMTVGKDGVFQPLPGDAAAAATIAELTGSGKVRTLYPEFVRSTVVTVLSTVTTDVKELARACVALYPIYLQPLVGRREGEIHPAALWPRFESHLGEARRLLYQRELKLEDGGCIGEKAAVQVDNDTDLVRDTERATKNAYPEREALAAMDLSLVSKRLLLAAFLAANNPVKLDTHYFSVHTDRRKRRRKGVSKRAGGADAGSKALPLNRIISIFDAIQNVGSDMHIGADDARANPSAMSSDALIHLSTLVSLSMLTRDASGDVITEPKFRCSLSLAMAQAIAADIKVDLWEHLHEAA